MKDSPAYLRAPAEACRITGAPTSSAAAITAWTCSRLLTLNAGMPYLCSAAWSSSWRMETSGMENPKVLWKNDGQRALSKHDKARPPKTAADSTEGQAPPAPRIQVAGGARRRGERRAPSGAP